MPKYKERVTAPKFVGDGSELTVKDLKLSEIVKTLNLMVPIGTIMAYGGAVHESDIAPEEQDKGSVKVQDIRDCLAEQGWLVCDGSKAKIEDHSALYGAIGCAFGGDKKTYFNLPDLRGRFLRGVDHGAGLDPDAAGRMPITKGGSKGNAVGSVQEDAFAKHTHTANQISFDGQRIYSGGGHGKNNVPTGEAGQSTETRPKNIYVNYIIKAKNII